MVRVAVYHPLGSGVPADAYRSSQKAYLPAKKPELCHAGCSFSVGHRKYPDQRRYTFHKRVIIASVNVIVQVFVYSL